MRKRGLRVGARIFKIMVFLSIMFSVLNFISCIHEINNGDLIYEKNIGWLDINHSIPDGAGNLIGADTVYNYRQFMKISLWDWELMFGSEMEVDFESIHVPRDKVAFYVFQQVSNHFEELQGKMPFYWFDLPFSSSFAKGDISGNIVSFFCAQNNISIDSLINKFEIAPSHLAFDLFLDETNFKNEVWDTDIIIPYLALLLGIDDCGELNILEKVETGIMEIQLPSPSFFLFVNEIND